MKASADRDGERNSPLQPQYYGGALDKILPPTHAVERKLSYSGHLPFANLTGWLHRLGKATEVRHFRKDEAVIWADRFLSN